MKEAEEAVDAVLAQDVRKMVFDFEGLDIIFTIGIRLLLVTIRKLRGPTEELVVCSPNPQVRDILEIALPGILKIFDSETDATRYLLDLQ